MGTVLTREPMIRALIETRGWPLVNALVASGFVEWLELQEAPVTATAIASELRQRLPAAVIVRSRAHMHRREVDGPAHRCPDCAFR
jgi:hypothetical protein